MTVPVHPEELAERLMLEVDLKRALPWLFFTDGGPVAAFRTKPDAEAWLDARRAHLKGPTP